jgi:hypothetical protein
LTAGQLSIDQYTKGAQLIGRFKLLHKEEYPDYKSARKKEKILKSVVGREFLNHLYPATWPASDGQGRP